MTLLDLLYVHPSATLETPSFFFMPAGVLGLLNEARAAGWRVLGLNAALEQALEPDFRLEDFVRAQPARLYALDAHWHEHLYGALAAARAIRRADPGARIVLGGISATHFRDALLAEHPEIDWVARGYAEGTLPRLLDDLAAHAEPPRGVLDPPLALPDLDATEQVDLTALLHAEEYTRVALHRWHPEWSERQLWYRNGLGCLANCSFCGGARSSQARIFGHRRVLRRSAPHVARDLVALARQGINTVAFVQDPSEAPEEYLETLFGLLAASGVRLGAYIEASALPSRAFLERFARTFEPRWSTVALSPLSGDEGVRRRNGKAFDDTALLRTLADLVDCGVRTALYFTSGLPGEQAASRARTHLLRRSIQRRFRPALDVLTTLTLDPASPMQRAPRRHGVQARLNSLADYVQRGRLRSEGQAYDALGYALVG